MERSGSFAVNLLREEQRELSIRFADRIPPEQKFEGLSLERGMGGVPLLQGTLGALECRTEAKVPVGDHYLFLGRVVTVHGGRPGKPLATGTGTIGGSGRARGGSALRRPRARGPRDRSVAPGEACHRRERP
ncbi:Flavin reductase-like, FMN-binding domain protein, partial [mine drainage metagenome]